MKYLSIIENSFGFKVDGIHEILETDVPISDEVYNRFFELQSQGEQFRIKDINGVTFEDIFEEVIQEDTPLTPEEEISNLKAELKQTDYKIIKCCEYQLKGIELPYDIVELHVSRQAIRDRINELESAKQGD